MSIPFENMMGDTGELRIIEFLLSVKGLEFGIDELSGIVDLPLEATETIVKKLVKWEVLKYTESHVSFNECSGFVEAFEILNNCIINKLLKGDMDVYSAN